MRILFIGESWLGSCARSLKEALSRRKDVVLDEVCEDHFLPKARSRVLRAANRLLAPLYRREFGQAVLDRVSVFAPDVVVTYKGWSLEAEIIQRVQATGRPFVNIYPDCSPHAHGRRHKEAVGAYDLVISTKRSHPANWHQIYGYQNACAFVPQGYDPLLHFRNTPAIDQEYDVTLVATWRPEYGELMRGLAQRLDGLGLRVGIGGNGWTERAKLFPHGWEFVGSLHGQSYVDWIRKGKICIAPVTTTMRISSVLQPGDEDSTRTYELAAACCFFVHRRTNYVSTLYDEATEVPMFDTAADLSSQILRFLPLELERQQMARAAQQRAVPSYSLDARAAEIVRILYERRFRSGGEVE